MFLVRTVITEKYPLIVKINLKIFSAKSLEKVKVVEGHYDDIQHALNNRKVRKKKFSIRIEKLDFSLHRKYGFYKSTETEGMFKNVLIPKNSLVSFEE